MNVAALIRVSRPDQTTDPQRLAIEAWIAREMPSANVQWYVEPFKSGASKKRPVRDALLQACRDEKHHVVVVAALDRWGRRAVDIVVHLDELRALGVRMVSLREGVDFATTSGQLVASVIGHVAQIEREAISERTKAGLVSAKQRARQRGKAPYGTRWRRTVDDRAPTPRSSQFAAVLEPVPEELAVVRRALDLYAQLGRWDETAAALTDEGHRTRGGGTWIAWKLARACRRARVLAFLRAER